MSNLVVNATGRCNMACRYCYASRHRGERDISDDVLECLFQRALELEDGHIDFFWQGGETLLLGLGFFKKVKRLQEEILSGRRYLNHVQTNGTLLNRKYAKYFRENNFSVGVSLDGPKEIHDANRVYSNKKGTYGDVMKGVEAAKKENLKLGFIAILTKTSVNRVEEIYRFFTENNFLFRLNPVAVQPDSGLAINPEEYGKAIIKLYDLACESDEKAMVNDDRVLYNLFLENYLSFRSNLATMKPVGGLGPASDEYGEPTTRLYGLGYRSNAKRMSKTVRVYERTILENQPIECHIPKCHQRMIGIDYNGDVYPCIRFTGIGSQKLGSIFENSLDEIRSSKRTEEICKRKLEDIGCSGCRWSHICNGGCPYIAYMNHGTRNARDYYCEGYKMVFSHISRRLAEGRKIPEEGSTKCCPPALASEFLM